ncbi:MAG TPA: DUF6265 family protein [Gemmatimonadales bacterium]|nr:DUF6265 family protein [Gemmatimonadales bacterium]
MRLTNLLPVMLTLSSAAVLQTVPSYPPTGLPAPPSIQDLQWLEGTWRGEIGDRQFEARYTSAEGGQLLSASKYTKDGQPAGFEFERFEEQGDTLVLTPFPEGKSSVTFKLSELDSKNRRAVFENPAHDFPTRISYQRVADNKLLILVSGPGEDGNEQVLTYALDRKR